MKKLILGIVFVFATGTMMNANSSKKITTNFEEDYCLDLHMRAWQFLIDFTGDPQIAVETSEAIYLDCIEEFE